mgnify:FL=1
MKFIALLVGKDDGCDYGIDCNKAFEVFEVASIQQALDKGNELINYYGKSSLESIQLFEVGLSFDIPLDSSTPDQKDQNLNYMFSG